jgi:hypothetical protein
MKELLPDGVFFLCAVEIDNCLFWLNFGVYKDGNFKAI